MLTDLYELTMLDAALHAGVEQRRCVFELFTRELPPGRRYGVVMGVDRAFGLLDHVAFDDDALAHLSALGVLRTRTLEWLTGWRFGGTAHAFRDGEIHVANEPVVTVEASFGEAVILETLLLSVLNHDSAVASAAARMLVAADGRSLMEFGSRRTHEQAAVAAASVAVTLGFDGTSNLEASRRHRVPALGTSAHAFTLLFDDEQQAFDAQVDAHGRGTTLLVDTYDIPTGIERAVKAAGTGLAAIRIDSGDLFAEAVRARHQLDTLGATTTRIIVSGDLDEYKIARLADAPIDGYGVGTRLVLGSGQHTAGFVYKLVARALDDGQLRPVAKSSAGKQTRGGRKHVWRRQEQGRAVEDVVTTSTSPVAGARELQHRVVTDGRRLPRPKAPTTAAHHRAAMRELPPVAHQLSDGPACLPVTFEH